MFQFQTLTRGCPLICSRSEILACQGHLDQIKVECRHPKRRLLRFRLLNLKARRDVCSSNCAKYAPGLIDFNRALSAPRVLVFRK